MSAGFEVMGLTPLRNLVALLGSPKGHRPVGSEPSYAVQATDHLGERTVGAFCCPQSCTVIIHSQLWSVAGTRLSCSLECPQLLVGVH